jgi:hypothetical protein
MKDSILNINVSCFAHCKATTPVDVNLLAYLTSEKYRDRVEQIRSLQDEALQKAIKITLPGITPSGRFSYRDTEHLIEHTGFINFDIDEDKNPHLTDFALVRDQVSRIKNVAYCGLSVRGRGCWGLIPIPPSTPAEHTKRFNSLSKDFADALGINLDPACSDVCRLRIYSWDPDAYFNHHAVLYTKIQENKPAPVKQYPRPAMGDTRDRVEALIAMIREQGVDITASYKTEWFALAASLANEFGEGGRGYFHTLSQFHPGYNQRDTDDLFDSVIRKRYEEWHIGTLFAIAENYGIRLKSRPVPVPSLPSPPAPETKRAIQENIMPDTWGVSELESFFTSASLPSEPIRLDDCTLITDIRQFIKAELAVAKAHNGQERYLPYFERLKQLRSILN